jgi:hypothetical protein
MPKQFSPKSLTVLREPTGGAAGVGMFEYSDDYSTFHYRHRGEAAACRRRRCDHARLRRGRGVREMLLKGACVARLVGSAALAQPIDASGRVPGA